MSDDRGESRVLPPEPAAAAESALPAAEATLSARKAAFAAAKSAGAHLLELLLALGAGLAREAVLFELPLPLERL